MKHQSKNKNIWIIAGVVLVVVIIAFFGFSFFKKNFGGGQEIISQTTNQIVTTSPAVVVDPKLNNGLLRITNSYLVDDTDGTLKVKGIAENLGKFKLKLVEIRVRFLDANKEIIAVVMGTELDLGLGETWNFEIVYPRFDKEKVKSYELEIMSTIKDYN